MKVAVSYFSLDNYKEGIKRIESSNADFIHCDLCDGKYVEKKNFTLCDANNLLKNTNKKLDIHLMVNNPEKFIEDFAMFNTENITIHLNSCKNVLEVINLIKSTGVKAGIAINPDEDVSLLNDLYPIVDHILIMSVMPGAGGQTFNEDVLLKIDEINKYKEIYHFTTAIDGGINDNTIELIRDKDIDIVVCGSFITNNDDYNDAINALK